MSPPRPTAVRRTTARAWSPRAILARAEYDGWRLRAAPIFLTACIDGGAIRQKEEDVAIYFTSYPNLRVPKSMGLYMPKRTSPRLTLERRPQ